MRDLKDLLEPLSRFEMPDHWADVADRAPRRLPPEPRRPRVGVYALAAVAFVLIVVIAVSISPLGGNEEIPGDETPSPSVVEPTPTPTTTPSVGQSSELPGTGTLVFATGDGLSAIAAGTDAVRPLVTAPTFDGCCGISVAPDGRSVAYGVELGGGAGVVEVADVTTGEVTATAPSDGVPAEVAWSPDGTAFVFSDGRALEEYSLHGQVGSTITDPPGGCVDSFPAWSGVDGAIAFSRSCDGSDQGGIYLLANPDAAPTRILAAPPATSEEPWEPLGAAIVPIGLAWSPDATHLALAAADGSVWSIAADGSDVTGFAPPTDELVSGFGTVAWSPDGTTIACVRGRGIDLIDVASGQVRTLTPTVGSNPSSLSWTPGS